MTSREGARDSGHVYESLVFAGLALPARTSASLPSCVILKESKILNFDQNILKNKVILAEICQSKLRVRTEELWSYAKLPLRPETGPTS